MTLQIDSLIFPETCPGGGTHYWSIQYRAVAQVLNPRSGFAYISGPGNIILNNGSVVSPSATEAIVLENGVGSMEPGQSRTDNWGDIIKQMPNPVGTNNTCVFKILVGSLDYSSMTFVVHQVVDKTVTLTGTSPPPEVTYTIPSVTYVGDVKPGATVTVTATVTASSTSPNDVMVAAEIRDGSGIVHGSRIETCYIGGKTSATVSIPVVVAATAPAGAGNVCAKLL